VKNYTDFAIEKHTRVSVRPGRLHTVVSLEGDTQSVNIVFAGQAIVSFYLIIQASVLLIQLGSTYKQVGQGRIKAPARVQVVRGTRSQPLTVVIRYAGGTVGFFHR